MQVKPVHFARLVLAVGVALFVAAWWIVTGLDHSALGSHNAAAFAYMGLALAFASFLIPA